MEDQKLKPVFYGSTTTQPNEMPRKSVGELVQFYEKRIRDLSPDPGEINFRNTRSSSNPVKFQSKSPAKQESNELHLSPSTKINCNVQTESQKEPRGSTEVTLRRNSSLAPQTRDSQKEVFRGETLGIVPQKAEEHKDTRRSTEVTLRGNFNSTQTTKEQVTETADSEKQVLRLETFRVTPKDPNLRFELTFGTESEVDVLCVNCYECIPVSDVDAHSKICIRPVVEENDISSVDIRITKIMDSIKNRKSEATGEQLSLLVKLLELGHAALEKSVCSTRVLQNIEKVSTESLKLKNALPVNIFSRRLGHLVEAKGSFGLETLEGEALIKAYEEEAERQRRELERWKLRGQLLLQLVGDSKNFEEVNSDVGSDLDNFSAVSFSTGYSDLNSDVANLEEAEQVLSEISQEELEKYFYSLCLKKKMALPKSHQKHSLAISQLFKNCTEGGIPVSKWPDYVNAAFD